MTLQQAFEALVARFTAPTPPAVSPTADAETMLRVYVRGLPKTQDWAGNSYSTFMASLPTETGDWVAFLGGGLTGLGEGAAEWVAGEIEALGAAVKGVVSFYSVTLNPSLWLTLLNAWYDKAALPAAAADIKASHPDLYAAIMALRPLAAELDKIVAQLKKDDAVTIFIRVVGTMGASISGALADEADEIAGKKGDPVAQGRHVGRVVGKVTLTAIEVLHGLASITKLAATAARQSEINRLLAKLNIDEVEGIAADLRKLAPGLDEYAREVVRLRRALGTAYDDMAMTIESFTELKKKTTAFNKGIRDLYGMSLPEQVAAELQLDAHHIITKKPYHAQLQKEFARRLGWNTTDDMDSMALHASLHRHAPESGDLMGGMNVDSLTTLLGQQVPKHAPKGGFKTLEQLFDAHEKAYKDIFSMKLTDQNGRPLNATVFEQRLKPWFDKMRKRLKDKP